VEVSFKSQTNAFQSLYFLKCEAIPWETLILHCNSIRNRLESLLTVKI